MAADDGLRDWSALLGEDFLATIGQRLTTAEVVIRSRAVCNSWNRALLVEHHGRFPPSTHWLMLPYCASKNMNTNITSMSSTITNSLPATAPKTGCKGSDRCRCFYNVALHQFHHIEFPPGLQRKNCRGSAMGWLCMVGETPAAGISLFNPLTNTEIALPSIMSFPEVLAYNPEKLGNEYLLQVRPGRTIARSRKFIEKKYLRRIAMSAEPTSEECVVMGIRCHWGHRLAFCRPAEIEAGWKFVAHEEDRDVPDSVLYEDVVFWRDQFYALDEAGRVYGCDFSADPHQPTLSFVLDSAYTHDTARNRYLVVCPAAVTGDEDDQLMMVTRQAYFRDENEDAHNWHYNPPAPNIDDDYPHHTNANDIEFDDDEDEQLQDGGAAATKIYWTEMFRLFKMNKDHTRWEEVESIGCFALFLGFNSASSFVSSKLHPGLVPNSIYFTDDLIDSSPRRKHAGHDMGVYDIATGIIKPLYSTDSLHDNPLLISPLPVWFSPSPIIR